MKEEKSQGKLRILVVEDNKAIRKFLNVSLSSNGYQVEESAGGLEAAGVISSFRPDAVILDLGLPDIDGTELITMIRSKSQVPVIVLTVRDGEEDKIDALDRGADDYLTKPFGVPELLARLRAVLRRASLVQEEPVFTSGRLFADFSKRLVRYGDKDIDLTPTEYDIFKLLVQNAGRVLTHRQIIEKIWGKDPDKYEGAAHLLRVTVSNLRSKIEENPSMPEFIITEPAVGYRFKEE